MMYLGDQAVGLATSLPVFSDKVQIETGIYIPDDDIKATTNPVTIYHNIGTIPDFIFVQAFGLTVNDSYDKKYALLCSFQKIGDNYASIVTRALTAGNTTSQSNNIWSTVETFVNSGFVSNSSFRILTPGSDSYFKKGIPYYYVVGKFKEVTLNA